MDDAEFPFDGDAINEDTLYPGLILLTPEEQLLLWNALNQTPVLTEEQRRLGRIMRGEP